jgi:ADP-ribose pyrophosphatase YjhB (NUDIX family)
MNELWCNNCAKIGHTFNQCKIPITSFGCIVFRINKITLKREYLMICRRHSISFLDFIRGKYNINDLENIKYLFQQMTNKEKELIRCKDFKKIWNTTWKLDIHKSFKYNSEEEIGLEKFNSINNELLTQLLNVQSDYTPEFICNNISETIIKDFELFPKDGWENPEWGFPKGRREYRESDYKCAIREFNEETGIDIKLLHQLNNVLPIEENFMGSNYKTYKHKYYLMFMNYEDTLIETNFQKTEVSCILWKTIEDCIESIRPYNIEKKSLIMNIDNALNNYSILFRETNFSSYYTSKLDYY